MTEETGPTTEPLPPGTMLRRRYLVGAPIGRGEHGVTYEGYDETARQSVAVKEYFPRALADRVETAVSPKSRLYGTLFFLGSEAFLKQYQALTKASGNPNIASVFDAFFENGTAYAVMELLEGAPLETYLAIKKRRLTAGEAMYVAASMADALLVVDSLNTLHFDIGPGSLFVCTDGTIRLTDFGAAKAALCARREVDDAEPWKDLAALAGTLYRAMTGNGADGELEPHPDVPAPLHELFRQMRGENGAARLASVFEYRHALACVEVEAVRPEITREEIEAYDQARAEKKAAREQAERRRAEKAAEAAEQERKRRKKKIALLCVCGVLLALLLMLIIRTALL